MTHESTGIAEWICGGCGQRHGLHCTYFGHPGMRMTDKEHASALARMAADKQSGTWPFNRNGATSRFLQSAS